MNQLTKDRLLLHAWLVRKIVYNEPIEETRLLLPLLLVSVSTVVKVYDESKDYSPLNIDELALRVGINRKSVDAYLAVLEQIQAAQRVSDGEASGNPVQVGGRPHSNVIAGDAVASAGPAAEQLTLDE